MYMSVYLSTNTIIYLITYDLCIMSSTKFTYKHVIYVL